ncbi:protein-disulfide reductase DsbD [Neptuniibacter halophilus]|uniref:protein-disulfide reductase DsbD n=1 Tax=Neptuniibacter halophilus TaxID=651666 RepID=UPI0025741E3C|nr:protein-disulfide reductase DsbD [Neptuniibacter halophilus]
MFELLCLPRRLLLTLLLIFPFTASAGLFDSNPFSESGPLEVDQAFKFTHIQQGNNLRLFWEIPDDYYLYRDRIELKTDTTTRILQRSNSPAEQKNDPLFGQVWVYHNQAEVNFSLASESETATDATLIVTYQGCWEGGICYPPVTRELRLTGITPVSDEALSQVASEKDTSNQAQSSGEARVSVTPVTLSEQDRFAAMLSGDNLALTLLAFFVAGLALSFTPCVFPMIPILSSIIAGHGGKVSAGRGFMLSLIYVLAVSVTYTLAGIFAGLFGENLQAMFQNPWIIGSFSLIFVLLALSMFGFYELQLHAGLQSRLSQASNSRKGGTFTGVALMGLLSALIVGPCMAAPLAGALIYIGQSGDPVLGGSALFSMSLGMGVPLLLIGTSAAKLLPHAGVWMAKVKAVFGVLLLLMAIWMLDRIVPTVVTMWLTAVVLILSSVYMGVFSRGDRTEHAVVKLARGFGLIVLIYGASLMIGALSGSNSMLYPLQGVAGTQAAEKRALPFVKVTTPAGLEQQLEQARAAGQPVMLDFYADWCISCIELEVYTFADNQVQSALGHYKLIKVDVTANDSAAKALNRAYSLIGPPALIFYNANGEHLPNKTLIGVVDPEDFVTHISTI